MLAMTLDELDAVRQWMLMLGRKTAREKVSGFTDVAKATGRDDENAGKVCLINHEKPTTVSAPFFRCVSCARTSIK